MAKGQKIILFTSLPKVGGHSTLTLGLCKFFIEWFDMVEIWCKIMPEHGHSDDVQIALEKMGCQVEIIGGLNGKINFFALLRSVVRAWRVKPTVFFVLTMGKMSPFFLKVLPKVYSIYYYIAHDLKNDALKNYDRIFSQLVFICPATYSDFSGIETKCSWAPQPSEMPDISRDTLCRDREKGVAALPDRVCFGLLGRLTREKGAEDILKFIESCDVSCEFHVAGVGPYADRFAALAAEGEVRPAVVKFYGTYEPTMRAAFFAQFFSKIDWLVVPSIDEWETLSMVTLEAIQHGVPVLCSQAGGLRSFGMPELGPAPSGVIDLFDPMELGGQLREKVALGKTPLMAIDRCREHYKQFFADSVVAQRWYQLVVEDSSKT